MYVARTARLIIAMTAALLTGCDSAEPNCPVQFSSASPAAYEPSQTAILLAEHFSEQTTQKAQTFLDDIVLKDRERLQKKRATAEKEYQEAKARRERPKAVPRPLLPIQDSHGAMFNKIRFNSLLAEFYDVENSPRQSIFIKDGVLTPAAEALLDILEKVDDHALDIEDFAPDKLRAGAKRLHAMHEIISTPFRLNPFEIEAISRALEDTDNPYHPQIAVQNPENGTLSPELFEWLCDFDKSPVPRAAAQCQKSLDNLLEMHALDDALEFALADAWMAYSAALRYGNLEKFSEEELTQYASEDNPNEIHPKNHDKIVETRLTAALHEFISRAATREEAAAWLNDLIPQHEQYAKLQAARARYRKIVEDGGWESIPPDRMFAGGHAPLVKNLKSRLAVEGYYTGNIDDAFDKPLTEAIKNYQKYHQLEETGEVGEVFWRSLNVPATQRLAEIEVNIRRWHKTLFEPIPRYIWVNIPSFTVELWNDSQKVSTHRVVVGSSTRICNTRTREWELMNSTHLMHARMTYLVFNPYWNVPPRIEVDEFLPKMAADPKWLENSDYEYVTPRGGGRVLRQKPGENNSLGKVKLIFPNRYNIYLHDTPKQGMFQYPVRAFSHGCMRVEKAMDFAREVLQSVGQYDEKQIARFFKEKGEHALDLNTPIDVFIEYHTVTVDEDGQPYFLADIYKIIRNEISPPTALERQCNPATDRTSTFRSGGGEDSGP